MARGHDHPSELALAPGRKGECDSPLRFTLVLLDSFSEDNMDSLKLNRDEVLKLLSLVESHMAQAQGLPSKTEILLCVKLEEYANTLSSASARRIVRNSVRCKVCNTDVESEKVCDYVSCNCGAIAVHGGKYHLRRVGNSTDFDDTSIFAD